MRSSSALHHAVRPAIDLTDRQAYGALIAVIILSTLAFSGLAYLKYSNLNNYAQDTALFGYAFHQTLHGRWLPAFVVERSLWGSHADVLMPLWLPVFWLVPTIYSLFLFQSLSISLAAWPTYLLGRRVTGDRLAGLLAASGLLLYPPVARVHVMELHDDASGLVFLLFAFYFFQQRRFAVFAGFLAVSLFAKETIFLNTVFFSVYALIERRNWRWVAFPVVWSAAYFLLVRLAVMPAWGDWWGGRLYDQAQYFQEWGKTPGQVMGHMLLHPLHVWNVLVGVDRWKYLRWLLVPLWVALPFGSWAWVPALPNLAVNLLSSNALLRAPTHWYSILLGGQLWASFVTALPFWNRRLTGWFGNRDYTRGLCAVVLLTCALQCGMWFHPTEYRRNSAYEAERQAMEGIPRQATVLAPDNLLAALSDRAGINSLTALRVYGQNQRRVLEYDYIIFDGNYSTAAEVLPVEQRLFDIIRTDANYRLVFARDNVFMFQQIPK